MVMPKCQIEKGASSSGKSDKLGLRLSYATTPCSECLLPENSGMLNVEEIRDPMRGAYAGHLGHETGTNSASQEPDAFKPLRGLVGRVGLEPTTY
jgi:hypothetical protein